MPMLTDSTQSHNGEDSLTSEITTQLLLSFLRCPLCLPGTLLSIPTTLSCGHTICASHVTLSSPSSSGSLSQADIVSSCHLPTCRADPPTSDSRVDNPLDSTVIYFPPPRTPWRNGRTSSNEVGGPKADVTISKIISLVQRWIADTDPAELNPESSDACSNQQCSDATPGAPMHITENNEELLNRIQLSKQASEQHQTDSPPSPTLGREGQRLTSYKFEQELLIELTCEICLLLLYEPVTTPCQHTFCTKCLQRSLDHNNRCPICRMLLPEFTFLHSYPSNKVISALILKAFPEMYLEKKTAVEEQEQRDCLDIPIFVCQLSFPGTPTILHIFEPRYRLMLRRCLQTAKPKFGMIMPPRINGGRTEFGTLLEIRTVQTFPDGRSIIKTWGTERFRLLETGTLDGYMVGRIDLIEDIPSGSDDELYTNHVSSDTEHASISSGPARNEEELMDICRAFLAKLRDGNAPWIAHRLNHAYGPEPEDPSNFSFWLALILPIDEHEKAKLLPIRSPRFRLQQVVHWIEQITTAGWFSSECMIQ